MYNLQYNNSSYNGNPPYGWPFPSGWPTDSIIFDGYGLQNENIITSNIDFDNLTQVELNSFSYPRENWGGVLSRYYRGRTISMECTIKSDTWINFNILLDQVKKSIRVTEWFLDITVNSEKRRIKATCTKFDVGRLYYNITFAKVKIEFTTLEPFFYAVAKQYATFQAKNATFSEEVTNTWSADSLPVFYHIFGAGSTVTESRLTAFGKVLIITNTFAPNDILIVNSENKTVTKNGVEIDYSGSFPIFPPGSNPFTIQYTGAVLVDVTMIQNKNYL